RSSQPIERLGTSVIDRPTLARHYQSMRSRERITSSAANQGCSCDVKMKKLFGLLVLLMLGAAAQAHPGVGIVADSRGNVFFTDLKQVWKVTPDGKQTVAVPDVHSHELCLDGKDNLYGEHYWHDAQTKKWMRRVWCLKSDGGLTEVLPAREG